VLNALFGVSGIIIETLLGFVLRTIFIKSLGATYLGVNGLMTSILSMLSLAELGVGTAITFSIYETLAKIYTAKINALMGFYKKVYRFIGIAVILIGLAITPFIQHIAKDSGNVHHLEFIFLLFLLNTSFTYFLAYKRTLMIADQKEYRLVPFKIGFYALTVFLQSAVLLFFENYFLFLIVQLMSKLLENLVINAYIHRSYDFLNTKAGTMIEPKEYTTIKRNIKAMFLHRIGDYAINGTDNVIISAFINVTTVGLYSNYYLLIRTMKMILTTMLRSATASFGNLLAMEGKQKALEKFEIFNFLAFFLYGWATVCAYNLFNPFISLWIGEKYLLSPLVLGLVLADFFLVGLRTPLSIVKMAAGVYAQDKYVPLIQAVVNLGSSLILVHFWGLVGVFTGTLLSSILVVSWIRPYIVYKYVFGIPVRKYFIKILPYFAIFFCYLFPTTFICQYFFPNSNMLHFMGRFLVCLTLPNILIFLLLRKTTEFQASLTIVRGIFKKGGLSTSKR